MITFYRGPDSKYYLDHCVTEHNNSVGLQNPKHEARDTILSRTEKGATAA